MTTDIQNLKSFDPFAEADDTGGETKTSQQNYIHIRIQRKSSHSTSFSSHSSAHAILSLFLLHPLHPPYPAYKADIIPVQSAMVARP